MGTWLSTEISISGRLRDQSGSRSGSGSGSGWDDVWDHLDLDLDLDLELELDLDENTRVRWGKCDFLTNGLEGVEQNPNGLVIPERPLNSIPTDS